MSEKPPVKLYSIRKVRLNRGGYDTNGHYFGVSRQAGDVYEYRLDAPKWHYLSGQWTYEEQYGHVRGVTRQAALQNLANEFHNTIQMKRG